MRPTWALPAWVHWQGNHYFKKSTLKGQAIAEIGVLGAILILLLGVLLNYGLKNIYQQQVMQQAFRLALQDAADSAENDKPLSVGHTLLTDRHIPDPANVFGLGQVMPFTSSAEVTRNYRLNASAENDAELPRVKFDIKGNLNKDDDNELSFKTAGFLYVDDVTDERLEDYSEVFGETNIFALGKDGKYLPVNDDDVLKTCDRQWGGMRSECENYRYTRIRILDYCAGQIADYGSCYKQCREMASLGISRPSYCGRLELDRMKETGIAPSYTKERRENNRLNIVTENTGITTTDRLNWNEQTTREVIESDGTKHSATTTVGEQDPPKSTTTPWD